MSPQNDPAEMKRKFAEALERKKGNAGDPQDRGAGPGTAHGAHGQADRKRVFRRKSG